MRRDFEDVQMTPDEIEEFLQVPRYGALATVKSGERPHIDPLGFAYRNGNLYFSLEETRVLLKRVANNPHGFYSVFDDNPPSSAAVQVEGPLRVFDDPDNEMSRTILNRHIDLGPEMAKFENAWLGNGTRSFRRVVLELEPTKIFAWNNRKTKAYGRRHQDGA
jgi:uncharacterized pyridoxamine 5'-phosphate oxidase family protein